MQRKWEPHFFSLNKQQTDVMGLEKLEKERKTNVKVELHKKNNLARTNELLEPMNGPIP